MLKGILIKIAFSFVVEFICKKAEDEKQDWKDDFCAFAKKIQAGL
jgi:hypothetical protein